MNVDSQYIKQAASRLGADLCGIASIERFQQAPAGFHPHDVMSGCRSVVVMASRLPGSVLNAESKVPYTFVRNMMVQKMDIISFELTNQLDAAGIQVAPIPTAEPYEYWDESRTHGRGIISLKHAAQLAGMGRIVKNTLLTNDKYGNRIWLGAVLVSEALEEDAPASYEGCLPDCELCLNACPQGALDGVTINQNLCRSRCLGSSPGGGWYFRCNACLQLCPHSPGLK